MHASDPLQPGSLLAGRYRLGDLLGSGGMAFVHRATDEVLGREVALKALIRTATDATELQRIRSEIDLLATLSHRALVTLFDAGTITLEGRTVTYLVMELVDGPALDARLALGPLAEPEVTRMAQDLAEALVVVHGQGVVHRDLKPANILLAPSPLPGREFDAKLADFGIAALVDAARLTATGTVLGTAAYLSPEQATGARVGPASDIYSLGLVLLETLTGQREFPGPVLESLSARLTRDPDVPGALGYEWKSLLTAMTARDPESRPTAAQVLDRVDALAGGAPLAVGAGAGATAAIVPDSTAAIAPAATTTAVLPASGPVDAATTADIEPGLANGPAASTAAQPARATRPRRRLALVGGVAAGIATLGAVAAFSLQGAPSEPDAAPKLVETSVPAADPSPAPTPAETAAPAAPAPAPAVEAPVEEQPAPAVVTDEGNGNAGNGGSGNGGGSNGGGSNGSGNGGGTGSGSGGGNGGGSGGGSGNSGGNGSGNGNGP